MRCLNSKEEHIDHLHIVLGVIGKHKLHTKFPKCEFRLSSVAFLGYVILKEGEMVYLQMVEVAKN